jgi:hypothetical protein
LSTLADSARPCAKRRFWRLRTRSWSGVRGSLRARRNRSLRKLAGRGRRLAWLQGAVDRPPGLPRPSTDQGAAARRSGHHPLCGTVPGDAYRQLGHRVGGSRLGSPAVHRVGSRTRLLRVPTRRATLQPHTHFSSRAVGARPAVPNRLETEARAASLVGEGSVDSIGGRVVGSVLGVRLAARPATRVDRLLTTRSTLPRGGIGPSTNHAR